VLLLDQPQAAAGYDSTRMVYQRQPQTLESYTQSAWVDTPARMLAPLLLHALQNDTGLRAVLLAPSPARADLRLQTSVLRLEQDFLQQPSRVHFALQATLSDQRTRSVLGWKRFDVSVNAGSNDAAGGAAAANVAVQAALQQLALFVQSSVAALPQPVVATP
jgi:cholesterol transport system auxiliary component